MRCLGKAKGGNGSGLGNKDALRYRGNSFLRVFLQAMPPETQPKVVSGVRRRGGFPASRVLTHQTIKILLLHTVHIVPNRWSLDLEGGHSFERTEGCRLSLQSTESSALYISRPRLRPARSDTSNQQGMPFGGDRACGERGGAGIRQWDSVKGALCNSRVFLEQPSRQSRIKCRPAKEYSLQQSLDRRRPDIILNHHRALP